MTFQKPTKTDDGRGGRSVAWAEHWTCWAAYRPGRAREQVEAGRLESVNLGILVVRSCTETRQIETIDRVMIGGQTFAIRSIENEDQRNRDLTMVVEKGVAP